MQYRILSLDGGGAWALIQVMTLINIYSENKKGHEILKHFDMVAANSGGSLVLGGLLENLELQELRDLFLSKQRRLSIFSPSRNPMRFVMRYFTGLGPKYSAKAKLPAIKAVMPRMGEKSLSQIAKDIEAENQQPLHILIVGYNYDRNNAKFFRAGKINNREDVTGCGKDSDVQMAEAIHASTNAPVNYFDAPATFPQKTVRYWDGAITGNNNPVMCAVTEAMSMGIPAENIVALSIGTASVALPWATNADRHSPYVDWQKSRDLKTDVMKLAKSILAEPVDVANYTAYIVTSNSEKLPGMQGHIVRMNPMISPVRKNGKWDAPDGMTKEEFVYLKELDMDAVEEKQVKAIQNFATLWLKGNARNQPIRMNGNTLELEIGDAFYMDAKMHWEQLTGTQPHGMGGDTEHRIAAE